MTVTVLLVLWNSRWGGFYNGSRVVNLVEFKVGRYLGQ